MDDRRKRGVCYTCEEPYKFGHVCKVHQIHMIIPSTIVTDYDKEETKDTSEMEEDMEVNEENGTETHITLHA